MIAETPSTILNYIYSGMVHGVCFIYTIFCLGGV